MIISVNPKHDLKEFVALMKNTDYLLDGDEKIGIKNIKAIK